jgi:hypothetical protein
MNDKTNRFERLVNLGASVYALWPVLAAAVGGIGAAIWAHLADLSPLSLVLYVILSSAGTLWTLLGVIWLWREMRPSRERIAFECAYGLALDGLHLATDDAQVPPSIQLGIVLRNASNLPLRYKVEEIHVIVGTTAIPYPTFVSDGGLISRGTATTYFYPAFPRNAIQPQNQAKVTAVVEFTIAYGHPDYDLVRRLKRKLDVSLRLDDKPGVVYLVRSESDEDIRVKA